MDRLKKLAYTTLICILCILTIGGCARNTQTASPIAAINIEGDEYVQLISDAWDSLSESEKETLIDDWRTATVSKEQLSGDILNVLMSLPEWENADKKITSSDVYEVLQVTFRGAKNSMLGDLHVFIDPDSKKVIGHGPRA